MSEAKHAAFANRLMNSSAAVFVVAHWLHKGGKTVQIPPLELAPYGANPLDYVDTGDITIIERKRVEVKHLGKNFTCAEDWPFGHGAFVSNKAAVDRSIHEVSAWVSVSNDFRYGAIITPESKYHWTLKKTFAKNTGQEETYYLCPIKHVVFRPMPVNLAALGSSGQEPAALPGNPEATPIGQ